MIEKNEILSAGSGKRSTCVFKICGLTGREIEARLVSMELGRDAEFSISSEYPDVTLHLKLTGAARSKSPALRAQILAGFGSHVYAEDDRTLEQVCGDLLLVQRLTLALAESCTGGYISHRITRVAGSSAYYYGGAVTYSNAAKILFLGVKRDTLEGRGAVSRETALEMSRGVRDRTGADIGLSVTGIAGPAGGSAEKPVGTVWVSIARESYHEARRFQFSGEREHIIFGASQEALNWLRLCLL